MNRPESNQTIKEWQIVTYSKQFNIPTPWDIILIFHDWHFIFFHLIHFIRSDYENCSFEACFQTYLKLTIGTETNLRLYIIYWICKTIRIEAKKYALSSLCFFPSWIFIFSSWTKVNLTYGKGVTSRPPSVFICSSFNWYLHKVSQFCWI